MLAQTFGPTCILTRVSTINRVTSVTTISIVHHAVADLYMIVFDAIFSDHPPSALEHGRAGYYFAENGEHKLYDVCKKIAEILYECGRGKSPEPTTYDHEETRKYFTPNSLRMMGANARCEAKRSQLVGWKPVMSTADMLKSIQPEVEAWIHKMF